MKEQKPQPWHEADQKPEGKSPVKRGPIGTHSLTGGGAAVGMPEGKTQGVERGDGREGVRQAEEPDPMAEPRVQAGDILGGKTDVSGGSRSSGRG